MEFDGTYIQLTDSEQRAADLPAQMLPDVALTMASQTMRTADMWRQQAIDKYIDTFVFGEDTTFKTRAEARQYYDTHLVLPDLYRRWSVGRKLAELCADRFAEAVEHFVASQP